MHTLGIFVSEDPGLRSYRRGCTAVRLGFCGGLDIDELLRGSDLGAGCEQANFEAVQGEGATFFRRDWDRLGRILPGYCEEMPQRCQALAIGHRLCVGGARAGEAPEVGKDWLAG